MKIYLKKFGTTLTSRQSGKEAYLALQPMLKDAQNQEELCIDFDGVVTFSPSWGDEFLTPLNKIFGERLVLENTSNTSVEATLKLLENVHQINFKGS